MFSIAKNLFKTFAPQSEIKFKEQVKNNYNIPDVEQRLLCACGDGTEIYVKKYINLGANVNCRDLLGNTPLHLACQSQSINPEIITTLLKNNCIPNEKNNEGDKPLHLACRNRFSNSEIITTLLKNNCRPNEKNNEGNTPLHLACRSYCENQEIITTLLKNNCIPNEKNKEGDTPLHLACRNPNINSEIITTLLKNNCKPNEKNNEGNTPLHSACRNDEIHMRNPEIITTLLNNNCKPNEKNNEGDTPLHLACSKYHINTEIITTLLKNNCKPNEKNNEGDTPLHLACSKYHINTEIITTLLKNNCKPNEKNNEGDTPLHLACSKYHINTEIITTLLKNNCKPNEKNNEGNTPLHLACRNNEIHMRNPEIITTLLKNNCKPNEKNNEGRTALHVAVDQGDVNPNVVNILLENGCKNEKDIEGDTPLHLACRNHRINPEIIPTLLKNNCKPNEKNNEGRTALHVAVDQRYYVAPDVVKLLLENGCKNEKDIKGRTALHIAAGVPNVNPNIIQDLLEYGCFPNVKDEKGQTALHAASSLKYVNPIIIKTLLKHGCKPDGMDSQGNSPYMNLIAGDCEDNIEEKESAMKILKEYEDYWQLGLPIEVKELDKKSAKVFASLLEEDEYQHHEARVMLAGEQGTGKTTVARYLVGKGPTKIRMSTDGIDLYNGLSFIDRETKEWLHGKQDFTLSEIAISRILRQEEDISTNLNANEHTVHPETSEIPSENISGSAHFNSHSPYMTTKQELTLNGSIPVNNAVTLDDFMEENHSGDGSYIVSADETMLDQPEKMQNKYSNYDKNVDPSFTDSSRIVKEKIQIESLPAFSENSYEENQKKENTVIAQSEVHLEPPFGRLYADAAPQGETFVPRTEIVKYTHADKSSEGSITTEVVNDPGIISKLKYLFGIHKHVKQIKVLMTKEKIWKKTLKIGKKKLHQKKIAPVIIWDFGGQDVFYSTHQTFLTYRAIYLIVLDGSRNLDDPCPFEQYLPGKSGHKTARDYLKFWINTIVTYCKGSRPGFPKIMIVLTHKDKVNAEEVESRRVQVFHDLEKMFSGSPLISHLVIKDRIFVNARNKDDPEMTKIKQNIIHQAMDQPTWGQRLPKCFIPLELEFDSLLDRNIPLITMEHMTTINHVHPVRSLTEDELQVFLKFQHSVGRILYFEAAHLNQHIILAPTHLIDAFKSIVTDRSFCKGDRLRQESWDLMSQKGVIKKKSIEEIWKKNKYKKFQEHKEYLLGVMTHLDILVEPKRYDKSHKRIPADFYFIASMVRTNNTTGYLESPNFTQRNIAIAFISSSSMIPPALSFRFISYCLSLFAVKTHGQENDEMLFRMSAVFTIDPSLDMCVSCDDDIIVVRLVHATNRALIMRDLASSVKECLAAALEKISQLYVKTSSTGSLIGEASFNLSLCCSSPVDPCLLPMFKLQEQDDSWICPKHGIGHTKDVLSSWALQKEQIQCGVACPVTDNDFLNQLPTDIHLRRLSMQYSVNELKELLVYLKKDSAIWEALLHGDSHQEPEILKFETLRKYRDEFCITFNDIKQAIESGNIRNPHTLCKVVRGKPIDFDQEPELWDLIPSEQHFDKLAPLVGNNSLSFLVELGMEFATWEQIRFKQNDRDLVKLNLQIMQEWKTFCNLKTIRPSLRHIGQAFNNIGKNIKLVENALADFF